MKFLPVTIDTNPNIIGECINTDEYDRIVEKSREYVVARLGLGPYVGFGLSNVHGTLTMAIG